MKPCCPNPCAACSRVPFPEQCDNIQCTPWRRWFLARWEQMQTATRQQMDRVEAEPLGVPLGGRHYAPPHRIREYRAQDPCKMCAVKPLCKEKCTVRKLWEQQGGIQ